jgi:hypothetical protein
LRVSDRHMRRMLLRLRQCGDRSLVHKEEATRGGS